MNKTLLATILAFAAIGACAEGRDPTVSPLSSGGADMTQPLVPNLASIKGDVAVSAALAPAAPASAAAPAVDVIPPAVYEVLRDLRGNTCFLYAGGRYCVGDKFGKATVVSINAKDIKLKVDGVVTTIARDLAPASDPSSTAIFIRRGNPAMSPVVQPHSAPGTTKQGVSK